MQLQSCPSCQHSDIEDFFRIKNAPIFSLVTIKSKEEALAVPRKDIELAFCSKCGFIFNRLFDTSIDYFTMGYEDQQGFSPTFMEYLSGIASGLIEKYNLKGKKIVEIGCGKGDFVNLLNTLAGGEGVGIDPAFQDGRQTNPNLTFYKEYYGMKHGAIGSDLICCRHTLEHIHNTLEFLTLVRDSLGEESSPIMYFDLPQVSRILDIQAFWDIYYEHCSYFSAGSLAKLFRRAGFELLDMRLDYSDQYIAVEAKPVQGTSLKTLSIEEDVEELKKKVDLFKTKVAAQLSEWRDQLEMMKRAGKRVVVWGGGSKSVGFLTNFADLDLIDYVVDINPNMKENYIPGIGKQYVQPDFLEGYQPDVVIIMNGVYEKEITKSMHDMGVFPQVLSL